MASDDEIIDFLNMLATDPRYPNAPKPAFGRLPFWKPGQRVMYNRRGRGVRAEIVRNDGADGIVVRHLEDGEVWRIPRPFFEAFSIEDEGPEDGIPKDK